MGLRDRLLTPAGARAVTAPSAILLAGAGMSAAVLAGLPIAAAAAVGAVAWGVRVLAGLPRPATAAGGGGRIDPGILTAPWRKFVIEALDARQRYRRAVEATTAGPLRERLEEIGRRVDAGVQECWRIARRGQALDRALGQLDAGDARSQLAELERNAAEPWFAGSTAERKAAALQAQVESAERIAHVAADTRDRLEVLDARLDEAVARAVELSVSADTTADLAGLGDHVEGVVTEMESLRQALEATEQVG